MASATVATDDGDRERLLRDAHRALNAFAAGSNAPLFRLLLEIDHEDLAWLRGNAAFRVGVANARLERRIRCGAGWLWEAALERLLDDGQTPLHQLFTSLALLSEPLLNRPATVGETGVRVAIAHAFAELVVREEPDDERRRRFAAIRGALPDGGDARVSKLPGAFALKLAKATTADGRVFERAITLMELIAAAGLAAQRDAVRALQIADAEEASKSLTTELRLARALPFVLRVVTTIKVPAWIEEVRPATLPATADESRSARGWEVSFAPPCVARHALADRWGVVVPATDDTLVGALRVTSLRRHPQFDDLCQLTWRIAASLDRFWRAHLGVTIRWNADVPESVAGLAARSSHYLATPRAVLGVDVCECPRGIGYDDLLRDGLLPDERDGPGTDGPGGNNPT